MGFTMGGTRWVNGLRRQPGQQGTISPSVSLEEDGYTGVWRSLTACICKKWYCEGPNTDEAPTWSI
jgi:hypothetical protein